MLIMNGQKDLPEGAIILFIILASNKTQLTVLSSDKQAWPIYLRIGNIDKRIQRCLSTRMTILIGYLPVMKLKCFTEKQRSNVAYCYALCHVLLVGLIRFDKDTMGLTTSQCFVLHSRTKFRRLNDSESALLAVTVTSSCFGVRGVTCDGHSSGIGCDVMCHRLGIGE